jgi:hypothetical protein
MTDFGARARRPIRRTTIDRRMPAPSATRRSRSWPIWFAGALSLGLSFFVTLQLTGPARPPSPAVTAMTRSVVSDKRTLIAAIRAAGLAGSPNVKGAIDEIARLDDKRVSIAGWAGEVGNGGAPLDVLVFVDGENRLAMQTEGRQVDVTGALGLSDAATARNVSFRGAVACGRGQKLIVVAIAHSGSYGYFSPRPCP